MIDNLKSQIEIRRKNKNLTIKDLEAQSGLSPGSILNVLIGRVQSPKIDTVVKLANFFDCSIDELVLSEAEQKGFNIDVKNPALFKESFSLCFELFDKENIQVIPRALLSMVIQVYEYSLENNLNLADKGFATGLLKAGKVMKHVP